MTVMKTAVVYYSMLGNTDSVAKKIADELSADLVKIEPVKAYPDKGFRKFFWGGKSAVMGERPELMPYSFDAAEYDRIIFGTPVWASNFTPPIRTFVEENRSALNGKKFAVFMCFSGGGADKAIAKLKTLIGIDEFEAELVLVDPKDKPKPEDEGKIRDFCEVLK